MSFLDDRLDASGRRFDEPDSELDEALVELVVSTRSAAGRDRRPRRSALVAATSAVLVATGTAAAASSAGLMGWATDEPVAKVEWRLPSGATCEQVFGDLEMADTEARDMLRAWFSDQPFTEIVDVEKALRDIRAETNTWVDGGRRISIGYGTSNYDADYEYWTAVHRAEGEAIRAKLVDEGYPESYARSWAGESRCSGSNPYPGAWTPKDAR